jgi:hypothetical protein
MIFLVVVVSKSTIKMCFAPYNLTETAENLKNLLSESMELMFDAKTWLPEGIYIQMCDELKRLYERCDKFTHPEKFTAPFCDWDLGDQLNIKNFLANINNEWSEQNENLKDAIAETEQGVKILAEIEGDSDDEEEIQVREFHHNGILYYIDDDNYLYDPIEANNHDIVGQWIPETGEIILID